MGLSATSDISAGIWADPRNFTFLSLHYDIERFTIFLIFQNLSNLERNIRDIWRADINVYIQ